MTPFQIRRRIRSLFVSQDDVETEAPEQAANSQAPTDIASPPRSETTETVEAVEDPSGEVTEEVADDAVEAADEATTEQVAEQMIDAPVEAAPVEAAPVEAVPVEAAPVEAEQPAEQTAEQPPREAVDTPPTPAKSFRSVEIARGLTSVDWRDRLDAVETLAGASDVNVAVPSLVEKLRDPSAEVAVAAARGLGHQRATSAVAPLRDVVRNQDGFFGNVSRQASLAALCEILGEGALPDLRAAVGDLDADLAAAAIELLSRHGTSEDGESLKAIVDDRRGFYHPVVRQAAESAIQRLPR